MDAETALLTVVSSGKAGHAWLLHGPVGSGKRALALRMAQAAMCTAADRPCGVCLTCQKLQTGNHTDLRRMKLEGRSHGVDTVRTLNELLMRKPYEAALQVVIVEDAQAMTPQAQNALLKTLEAPPGQAMLILLATNMQALLPTIRSRCLCYRMRPQAVEAVRCALEADGLGAVEAAALAAQSEGWLERARSLSQEGSVVRDDAFAMWKRVLAAGPGDQEAVQWAVEDRGQALTVLPLWEGFARDMLAAKMQADVRHSDLANELAVLAAPFTARAILDMMEEIASAGSSVRSNVQPQLALEAALWRIYRINRSLQ